MGGLKGLWSLLDETEEGWDSMLWACLGAEIGSERQLGAELVVAGLGVFGVAKEVGFCCCCCLLIIRLCGRGVRL